MNLAHLVAKSYPGKSAIVYAKDDTEFYTPYKIMIKLCGLSKLVIEKMYIDESD
jgi:hypothetical protein